MLRRSRGPDWDFVPANVTKYNAVDEANNEASHCTGGLEGRYIIFDL
jgi:hypothetical protein